MTSETNKTESNTLERRDILKYARGGFLAGSAALPMSQKAEAQTLTQASWIHGTSVQVEYIDRINTILRRGFHTYINGRGGTTNWFHYAIPTPVIVSGRRLRIESAMLKFKTEGATVTNVHIYDGPNRIAAYDYLNFYGDHPFERFAVPGWPEVLWGGWHLGGSSLRR